MRILLEGSGKRAEVETLGGELVSCQDAQGLEYIWQGDPAYWSGRNPLLFPVVGATRDWRVWFQGKAFPMERHGFARSREFTLLDRGADWAELELREDGQTLAAYPYPFRLRVRQALTGTGFSTAITVENPGTEPMPFCIGAHTAFRCPLLPGERFEEYRLTFAQRETCPTLVPEQGLLDRERRRPCLEDTDTLPLRYDYFDSMDTLIFEGLRSEWVSLTHKDTGRGVRVHFAGFPLLAFWTMPNACAPYLCIEPWQGCATVEGEGPEFTEKAYCVTLPPQGSRTFSYQVDLL